MTTKNDYKFIREHSDKEVLDRVLMEFYISVLRLMDDEIKNANQKSQTSS